MGFTVTHSTLSDPIDKKEIEQNFADIVNKSGNLTSGDLAADADIALTQLSHNLIEVWVSLKVTAAELASGWPGSDTVLDACPYLGSNLDEAWDRLDVQWECTDTGASNATWALQFGTHESGTWVSSSTLYTGTITNASANNDANSVIVASASYPGSSLSFTTSPRAIALVATGSAQSATLSAAGSYFRIVLGMRRKLQSH